MGIGQGQVRGAGREEQGMIGRSDVLHVPLHERLQILTATALTAALAVTGRRMVWRRELRHGEEARCTGRRRG